MTRRRRRPGRESCAGGLQGGRKRKEVLWEWSGSFWRSWTQAFFSQPRTRFYRGYTFFTGTTIFCEGISVFCQASYELTSVTCRCCLSSFLLQFFIAPLCCCCATFPLRSGVTKNPLLLFSLGTIASLPNIYVTVVG